MQPDRTMNYSINFLSPPPTHTSSYNQIAKVQETEQYQPKINQQKKNKKKVPKIINRSATIETKAFTKEISQTLRLQHDKANK